MQRRIVQSALVFALLASGCELVADFDRTKIPGNEVDSGKLPIPDDDDDEDAGRDAAASDDDAGK